jgi:predicted aldo/keto reductase-like oxidoreductase
MDKKNMTRRELLKSSIAAAAALAINPKLLAACKDSRFDAKGLPTRVLGRTSEHVPLLAVGTGSRFCAVKDEDEALNILTYALDNGLYYWDTAHDYAYDAIISEQRLGKILKHRRKEVFLATKFAPRGADEAKRHIEESLKRLQTDFIDILQIHMIESEEDVDQIAKKGGVLDVLMQMKEQGVARNIGFTGHTSAAAMTKAALNYEFDTMLIALNHATEGKEKFEQHAIPSAAKKGMGVMVMKVIRPRETITGLTAENLIRYALSLKHVNAAVIGTDNINMIKQNIALLKSFKPLDAKKMDEIRVSLAPFYRHEGLQWMQPHYHDGFVV